MATPDTGGTSYRDQEANRKAAERAAKYLSEVTASIGVGGAQGLSDLGIEVVNRVKLLLSQKGTGRAYGRFSSKTRTVGARKAATYINKQGTTVNRRASAGRAVTVKTRGFHVASAPGQPPAVDTGRLRSSYTWQLGQDRKGPFVEVGTNVKYAPWLEFGTRKMKPRPHLRPAINEVRRQIATLVLQGIVHEQRETVRRLPKEVSV